MKGNIIMENKVKIGDRVRVSKDAPKMYVPMSFWTEDNSIVEEICEGNAAISYDSNYMDCRIIVPIKYLLVNVNGVWMKPKTKPKQTREVEAEAKEAKFKVGDIIDTPKGKGTVRIAVGGSYSVQLDNGEWYVHMEETISSPNKESKEPKFKVGDKIRVCDPNLSCFGFVGNVTKVKDGLIFATAGNGIDFTAKESCLELVQSKEQVEADADDTAEHCDIPDLSELDRIRVREFIETHPFELASLECDQKVFEDMYWRDYEAGLAKDVALKVINKFDAPHEAAEYAVSVAKAVVEGLKRK